MGSSTKTRIDVLLVERNVVASRERARALILAGRVLVNEQKVDKPGAAVASDANIRLLGEDMPYVSRGGLKLEAALAHWQIDVKGRACLDVGASSGGFTDCLLQRGAAHVTAVDTGFGQIAMKLRNDQRVKLVERTNARFLAPGALAEPGMTQLTLLVMDVSFISATLLLGPVFAAAPMLSEAVILVKPQFEAGRGNVGKGGIVRDPEIHKMVVEKVASAVGELGWNVIETIPSPITGTEGNVEFLLYARKAGDEGTKGQGDEGTRSVGLGFGDGVGGYTERMNSVAIVSKPRKPELAQLLPELIDWLRKHDYDPLLDHEGAGYTDAAPAVDRADLPAHKPGLVIVLGGDGTLLSVARIFAATGTPILSVNLGSLGFLTEVRLADLYTTLESWCSDCHALDARHMLHSEVRRDGLVVRTFEALNEVVVSKGDIARMGEFAVELNGKSVAHFRADGVIVSTPTGSTAYTLAANGPILTPDVDALVVTPICPHLLTLRPIVVPGEACVKVRVEGVPTQCLLTVDGQIGFELHLDDEVTCQRSAYTVNLVRISESGFFEALRSKLSWGER